jgi:hypothetical protein
MLQTALPTPTTSTAATQHAKEELVENTAPTKDLKNLDGAVVKGLEHLLAYLQIGNDAFELANNNDTLLNSMLQTPLPTPTTSTAATQHAKEELVENTAPKDSKNPDDAVVKGLEHPLDLTNGLSNEHIVHPFLTDAQNSLSFLGLESLSASTTSDKSGDLITFDDDDVTPLGNIASDGGV